MATSTDLKQRAQTLAAKTDINSIDPQEVGGLFYDLTGYAEDVQRNGGSLGIRKVYASVSAMEADSTSPKDMWGNPMRKGQLCVIYDGTTEGVDNNKVFAFKAPGWEIATQLDAGYATRGELAELENIISNNWMVNSFYNLYKANNNAAFDNRELARKYWRENIWNKFGSNNIIRGSVIYYELTDGSKILEQLVGSIASAGYFKDAEWNYIYGAPLDEIQVDNTINDINDKRFIKNKNYNWAKGIVIEPDSNWKYTEDNKWIYTDNFSSSTVNINKEFTVTDNDNCLSFVVTCYSDAEVDGIVIQLYDVTNSKYIYNKRVLISNYPISFPVIIENLTLGNTYRIMVGKASATDKYYISYPLTYVLDKKPALIHFLHDVDKEIDNIFSDIKDLGNELNTFNTAFSTQKYYAVKYDEYTPDVTTTFGQVDLSDIDEVRYNLEIKSTDRFSFEIYAYKGVSKYKVIYSVPSDTDYSNTFYAENVIDVKSLKSEGYDNIKFRTRNTEIALTFSLFYDKKIAKTELTNQWEGAIGAIFGNSISAQTAGDLQAPYPDRWGGFFAKKLKLSKLFGRGVGGQTYKWNDGAYYSKKGSTGNYVNRYKAVDGEINQSNGSITINVTTEEIQAIESVLGYEIEVHRGCYCSWDRITSMFPKEIKDTIEFVCIMGGTNDFSGVEDIESSGADGTLKPLWSSENTTDTDWVNAEEFYNGGDYDINTTWGGMASCLMKMQIWMPQAKIIVLVPITRKGTNFNVPVNGVGATHQDLCNSVKSVADWCNVEVIDMNCCGITQFNIDKTLLDSIHPSVDGQKLMGIYLAAKFNSVCRL